jgi:tetratricopeptide (TPR) repeat protein
MKSYLLLIIRYSLIAAALAGALYAVQLARAAALYEEDTPTSLADAVHIMPDNSEYLDHLANWHPEQRESLLRQAVALNPYDFDAWTRLGLLEEMQQGDNAAAEKDFLKAAEVNHMFMPRWTLTNFYFRRQNAPEFFHWARLALEVTPYASDPVFSQMDLISQNPQTLNAAIPDRPRILLQYAWYLANSKQYNAIPEVVDRLVRVVGKTDARDWGRDDLIAVAEDHMIAAGFPAPALQVWASLSNGGWLKQTTPDDQHPVTNGDFRIPFYRHGFDWTIVESPGVRVDQFTSEPSLRVNLLGDQADSVVLLQQYVPVAPGKSYTMSWQAKGQDVSDPSGLAWHLHPIKNTSPAELVSPDLLSAHASWDFVAPADAKAFLLSLECIRPLGSVRARGAVVLLSVTMNQK